MLLFELKKKIEKKSHNTTTYLLCTWTSTNITALNKSKVEKILKPTSNYKLWTFNNLIFSYKIKTEKFLIHCLIVFYIYFDAFILQIVP